VQNDPSTDNFGQIRTDFDAQHGAGSFNAFTKNMGNLMDDGKGNLVVGKSAPDPNDPSKTIQVPATDKNGLPLFSIPKTDAPFWTNRYNAARIRAGQGYAGTLPDGVNPNSGQPSGSQINPIAVGDNLGLRSLPYNTWMQMPDGSVRQKLPQAVSPQGQQGQPAAQPAASSQPEGAAEQEGAEQQLESEEAGSEGESSGSASRGAAGGSPTSQLAGAVGGGISPMANPQMNLLMSGFQAPSATPPSYAGAPAPDTGQIASANVSPTGAAQSYLQSLGLGAGAGQLYPAGDLWG
jgi:hypothetical protein